MGKKVIFPDIKVSVVITILDSHAVVVRQMKHFKNMLLPENVEIILIDDGSTPPLQYNVVPGIRNLSVYPTCDYRPWTQACARNFGAKLALGEYLLMTDIDHILTRKAIKSLLSFTGDKMVFPRWFGTLDKEGFVNTDKDTLLDLGMPKRYLKSKNFSAGFHTNTFGIKKSIYMDMDGYHPKYCGIPSGANHGDKRFYKKYSVGYNTGKYKKPIEGPNIFVYPGMAKCTIEDMDPHKMFHSLTRG